MKILFHGWEYPPLISGVGMYMKNMATALVTCGHEAIVVTASIDGKYRESMEDGCLIVRGFSRDERGSTRVRDLVIQTARNHKADLIEGADHSGDCASLLRVSRQIPVMIKYHACQMVNVLKKAHIHYGWQRITIGLAMLKAWRQMRDELYSIEHADFACVPSRRLLQELRKQKLALPDKIAVIPNPILVEPLRPAKEAEEPTILFVGRIEFGKGVAFLPYLINLVAKVIPNVRLEIAGSDSYARGVGSLKKWVSYRLESASGNVRFLGPLGTDELDAAYRRAWVVIVPSLWDNFPTVVLEAMAKGKPIVTTPHGGMPEMLADTGSPIEDPSGPSFSEAVCRLLRDQQERERLGQANWKKVQDYSPEKIIPQYLDFIKVSL